MTDAADDFCSNIYTLRFGLITNHARNHISCSQIIFSSHVWVAEEYFVINQHKSANDDKTFSLHVFDFRSPYGITHDTTQKTDNSTFLNRIV